ncbi:mucin-5AC-like [Anopheles coustani]|uniref:mucin-5AC-like n=1 Tax=Anopheles coustani TaxID=139045 RepID=UPI002657B51F|nr:mucin-5AC-like [Anopheles coustani]
MSSMPCRKWCVLCLHDGSEHELFDVFSVNDLRERVAEEYEIQIKGGNGSPKICVQCFQETLTFRKQRKSYEADKERVLKNQKHLESQLVRGGREKTSSRLRSILDGTLTLIPNASTEKVSSPSNKESSSKKSDPRSINTQRNDGLASGSKQNSSQKIKSKEKTNSTSGSTNVERNKHISGHDTSDSQKRNNGSMTKDGIAASGSNSKSTLENRKRVRFSINDDTYQDPQKKLKFSEFVAKSDASSKNQGPQKFHDKKLSSNREHSDLPPTKGPDSKKDEPKHPTPLSNISGQSAEKTVTKSTTDKNSFGSGMKQQQQSNNSTLTRQRSDSPGSASKKATGSKESSKKSSSTYSGLKIKLQLGKQKTSPASSSKSSSKSSSNGTKQKRPDTNTTKVSTPVNVGASAPTSIQPKPTLVPIISGPTRSIDLVPENNQLHPAPAMNTPSFPVAIGQIPPRPTNDPSSDSQLQPVSVANTPKVVVPIGQIQPSSTQSFTSGESQPNSISVANSPSVVVPIGQIQPRFLTNPVPGETQLRQITVANTGTGLVPIGQLQTSNTATTVAVSWSFNSTPAISNVYSSATVPLLTSLVNATNSTPLIDLNQNISRGDVSAPALVLKPASISTTSAETNPMGCLTLTSVSPWQPSNVSTITSCPIVTPVSGKLQQRSNVIVTTTALPLTKVASPVLPLTTVASPVLPQTTVASPALALTTVAPPAGQVSTNAMLVSSHQETTTTSVAPGENTDSQSSNVGIKKRRHSTFIRVSTNLFDEPDAQFASLRNNLFVRNNEQATTSLQNRPIILNSLLHSTANAPGQTSLPIRTQANNSYQLGVSSGGLLFSNVSSQHQITRTRVHDETTIPVHVLYKPSNNRPQSTISNRMVTQNQNPLPRQVVLNQRMKVPVVQTAAATSANPTTQAVQITPRMPIPTQTSNTNATTNRYFIVKQSTTGNAVSTTNNINNVLPTGVVRTSTVTTTDVNRSVQNAPWNPVNSVTNPPQHRPILMCQLCAEFFLTEPLMGQHLNQVHFVEFSRSLFSTVYDESIRKLLVARARRKSIATPDDLRSER